MTRRVFTLTTVFCVAVLASGCQPDVGDLVPNPPPPRPHEDALPPPAFQSMPVVPESPTREALHRESGKGALVKKPVPDNVAWGATKPGQWTHIIIHHSAMAFGNARVIDRLHRDRNWDELGYHFVIDNGRGGAAGRVEVGPRWTKQKHGAHTRPDPDDDNYWNQHGIGICLVGNFNNGRPSEAQMASAARLVAFLMRQCNIPRAKVLGHGQVPGAQTDCPGRLFSYDDLFRRVAALGAVAKTP